MEQKVAAIIQARMTSIRLPGKVLMEVLGRPLLSYQIESLRLSKRIDDIIVATTKNREDDPIVACCEKEGVYIYRGSEDDVLDRYYRAARAYEVAHIMRLTADCPLIQPDICDNMTKAYFRSSVDYIRTGSTFAEGLDCEVVGFKALCRAWREADQTSEREHVTLYFRNHSDRFKTLIKENQADDSKYRITVDEKEDFLVVKAIIENLYSRQGEYIEIEAIKSFLESNPAVFALNSRIVRNEGLLKSFDQERRVISE